MTLLLNLWLWFFLSFCSVLRTRFCSNTVLWIVYLDSCSLTCELLLRLSFPLSSFFLLLFLSRHFLPTFSSLDENIRIVLRLELVLIIVLSTSFVPESWILAQVWRRKRTDCGEKENERMKEKRNKEEEKEARVWKREDDKMKDNEKEERELDMSPSFSSSNFSFYSFLFYSVLVFRTKLVIHKGKGVVKVKSCFQQIYPSILFSFSLSSLSLSLTFSSPDSWISEFLKLEPQNTKKTSELELDDSKT